MQREKASLPVNVRRSKTSLLKFPTDPRARLHRATFMITREYSATVSMFLIIASCTPLCLLCSLLRSKYSLHTAESPLEQRVATLP